MKTTFDPKTGMLTIVIPVNTDPKPSSTGKTLVVATSNGNLPTNIEFKGEVLTLGLNAFIKNRAYVAPAK